MAEEKEKTIAKDQETIVPAGRGKPGSELSEKDLEKAAGGGATGEHFPKAT